MEKLKQNYDRLLLIVIGVITLVVGSMLIMKSFAAGKNFPGVEEGNGGTLPETPVEKVVAAATLVDTEKKWEPRFAEKSEKRYRLFASIPIVNKDGAPQPIDLFDESTPVREGVSNKYIMDHNLPYRRNDVLSLDLDGDGFTILEEYKNGGTDPRDKNDYPDATIKLEVADITKEDYIVMFKSQAGGKDFSVTRMDPPPPAEKLPRDERWSIWVQQGNTFPDRTAEANRFKALKYEEKDVHTAGTSQNRIGIGVLTVEDSASKETIELVQKSRVNIPIFRASFKYDGPGEIPDKEFENGDVFKIEGTEVEITIVKVTENTVEGLAKDGDGVPKPFKRTLSAAAKAAPTPAPAPVPDPPTPEPPSDIPDEIPDEIPSEIPSETE